MFFYIKALGDALWDVQYLSVLINTLMKVCSLAINYIKQLIVYVSMIWSIIDLDGTLGALVYSYFNR
jgi:hypothetical protein